MDELDNILLRIAKDKGYDSWSDLMDCAYSYEQVALTKQAMREYADFVNN